MGKKMDAFLGRSFKPAKFKPLVKVAMTRLSVVKNQRQVRCSQARSDVVELLKLGHHERALLRVEQVIKEQNMVDVYVMMEGYCFVLIERTSLIEEDRECPEEMKEAISSLIYAASRCGELPEVQEIRAVLTSRYGKEFAARAIELRNNCGVNPKIIQKLSTRMPSLEIRMNMLKEIASENSITIQLEGTSEMAKENSQTNQEQSQSETHLAVHSSGAKVEDGLKILPEFIEKDNEFSASMKPQKYRDVAHAAQVAFESAAYAAAAARAAVELSKSESHDPDDHNGTHTRERKLSEYLVEPKPETVEKVFSRENYESESAEEKNYKTDDVKESRKVENIVEWKKSLSSSSGTSDISSQPKASGKGIEVVFDESDDDNVNKKHGVPLLEINNIGVHMKPLPLINEDKKIKELIAAANDPLAEPEEKLHYLSRKQIHTRFRARLKGTFGHGNSGEESGIQREPGLNIEKKPFSMRTRGVHVR